MLHAGGTTLTMAADQSFGGVGVLADRAECAGAITANEGGAIDLVGGGYFSGICETLHITKQRLPLGLQQFNLRVARHIRLAILVLKPDGLGFQFSDSSLKSGNLLSKFDHPRVLGFQLISGQSEHHFQTVNLLRFSQDNLFTCGFTVSTHVGARLATEREERCGTGTDENFRDRLPRDWRHGVIVSYNG